VILAASTGCATLVHGTRQTVTVTSDPAGAQVTVLSAAPDGTRVVRSRPGVTPIQLNLTRRDPNIVLRLEKEGCSPAEVRLKREISGWVATNLWLGNPFAMQGYDHNPEGQYVFQLTVGMGGAFAIDLASGGAYKLPRAIDVLLCRQ
jgi:hypothetical protein